VDIEVTDDFENKLLGRREVRCIFRDVYGGLTRVDAAQAVTKKISASGKRVYTVSIMGAYGTRDAKGVFYVYNDDMSAKQGLQEYLLKRNTPSEAPAEKAPAEKAPAEKAVAKPVPEEKPKEASDKTEA
jgi:ribosomal protein S24E